MGHGNTSCDPHLHLSHQATKRSTTSREASAAGRLRPNGFTGPTIPVGGLALVALLAVQVRMRPRSLDAFVLLCGSVRSRPIALRIPPQCREGVHKSGWR